MIEFLGIVGYLAVGLVVSSIVALRLQVAEGDWQDSAVLGAIVLLWPIFVAWLGLWLIGKIVATLPRLLLH